MSGPCVIELTHRVTCKEGGWFIMLVPGHTIEAAGHAVAEAQPKAWAPNRPNEGP